MQHDFRYTTLGFKNVLVTMIRGKYCDPMNCGLPTASYLYTLWPEITYEYFHLYKNEIK